MAGVYKSKQDAIECEVLRLYEISTLAGTPKIAAVEGILPYLAEETGYITSRFEGGTLVWYCARPTAKGFFRLVQEAVNRVML